MLSQTCARREFAPSRRASSPVRRRVPARRNVAGTAEKIPFGGYARLVGAPNCAPSLRSVSGLLLALALQSRLRAPSPPSLEVDRDASHHCPASRRARIRSCGPHRHFAREQPPLRAAARRAKLGSPVSQGGRSAVRTGRARTRGAKAPLQLQIYAGR